MLVLLAIFLGPAAGSASPRSAAAMLRRSQVCSALQPPAAAWVWPCGPRLRSAGPLSGLSYFGGLLRRLGRFGETV